MTYDILIRSLGRQPYEPVWQAMKSFTDAREDSTPDEIWVVEHEPVYTQGQAGKPEHILFNNDIPIVQSDRGGQVTYHGPGQLVIYVLLDVKRLKTGVRQLVTDLELSTILLLESFGIKAHSDKDAPGVYISEGEKKGAKIASLGLRVRKGRSYHGISLNVAADLGAFKAINPCGYQGLQVVNLNNLVAEPQSLVQVQAKFVAEIISKLGYNQPFYVSEPSLAG